MLTHHDTTLDSPYQAMCAAQDEYEAECARVPDYRRDADSLDALCPIEDDEPTEADWDDFGAWCAAWSAANAQLESMLLALEPTEDPHD